jgi:CAAX amino terminal protease family.
MQKYLARLGGASVGDVLPGLPFHRDFFGILMLCMMSVMFTMGVGMIVVIFLEAGIKGALNLTSPSLNQLLFESHPNGRWATEQLVGHTIDLIAAAGMLIGLTQINPKSLSWFNWKGLGIVRLLLSVAAAYAIYRGALWVVFDYFQVLAGEGSGSQSSRAMQLTFGERIPMLVSTLIVSPVLEELVFRGYVYNVMRTNLRRAWAKQLFCAELVAVILGAGLFALLHAFGASNAGLLQIMIGSVILTVLYRLTGSLAAPIALHFTFNAMIWYHMLSQ